MKITKGIPGARFVAIFASLCWLLPSANSALLVYDGFNYEPGQSLEGMGNDAFSWGTNRWLKHHAVSDWSVVSNSLIHPSVAPTGAHVAETNDISGADYERKFAPFVFHDGDSVWFSFLVKVTRGATWDLLLTSAGLNSNEFGVKADYTDYRIHALIGVGYNGSVEALELGSNITRLVVGRYRYSQSEMEQLDLWVDPDISFEPQPGGPSASNHMTHFRQHDLQPAGIDSVLLENRSIGSLAFDELRVGTTWRDVVPSASEKVIIDRISISGGSVYLDLRNLSPGITTTVERAAQIVDATQWDIVDTFIPSTTSTNWTSSATGENGFYRVRVR